MIEPDFTETAMAHTDFARALLLSNSHLHDWPPMTTVTTVSANDLKHTGLKATLPRLKVLEIFQKGVQRHMSAEDVFRALLDDRTDIGLATVYRVLLQFEQAGILSRSQFDSDKAVYELNEGTHHDHLVCLDCGRVEEFYDPEIERRQAAIAKDHGFEIADHALSVYGHCTKTACPHKPVRGR